jgi:anti-sigma B factor antagonist
VTDPGSPPSPAADFDVVSELSDGTATVSVRGEVDVYTAPQLRDRLYAVVADGVTHVVLDLAAMTFIDSTGLGVIVGTLKRLREAGGDLVLRSPSRSTRKVLEITGLTRIVEIEA